jgi:6,7-dimethyl-8-ribityllumazine synthase
MHNLQPLDELHRKNHDMTKENVLIIASRANDMVVSRLIEGAKRALRQASVREECQHLVRVPGALEIPLALNLAARCGRFNAFVVLGAVIKGKTDHYDHVARMANDGVVEVALKYHLCVGNGILTVHSLEHALERADGPAGNLGFDAAKASVDLLVTSYAFDKNRIDK